MAREYVVSASAVTLAGATTLIFVNPGTTCSLEFFRATVNQSATATSAMCRIQFVTQVTAFPTLTSATPAKLKRGDPVSAITGGTAGAAGTSGINASAEGAGAKTVVTEEAFNNVNGWLWEPPPWGTIVMPASSTSGLGVYFPAAPGTLTGWSGSLYFREIG